MTFNVLSLTDAISKLTILNGTTPIRIYDLDEVPDEILPRFCPCLWPDVNAGVVSGSRIDRMSFGGGGITSTGARKDLVYTINYCFCYMPVGTGRMEIKNHFPKVATITGAILAALIGSLDTVTGSVSVDVSSWSIPGRSISDPAGSNQFSGSLLSLLVNEFTELG